MKNISIIICGLFILVLSGNCQRNDQNNSDITEDVYTEVQTSATLTLSGNQLIFLDWDGGIPTGARVVRPADALRGARGGATDGPGELGRGPCAGPRLRGRRGLKCELFGRLPRVRRTE